MVSPANPKGPVCFSVLKPYRGMIILLVLLSLIANSISLAIPNITRHAIDAFIGNHLDVRRIIWEFVGAALGVFVFTYGLSLCSDLYVRTGGPGPSYPAGRPDLAAGFQLSAKNQPRPAAHQPDGGCGLHQGICGAGHRQHFFFHLYYYRGEYHAAYHPVAAGAVCDRHYPHYRIYLLYSFEESAGFVQSRREVIDALNKVISESILGAALIRVIHSQQLEYAKFLAANSKALGLGLRMLKLFATLIPVIIFTANLATLTILALGGHYVIAGRMTLGDFAAFNSYLNILIFPILVIGFMSNVIAQAQASFGRISAVLHTPDPEEKGMLVKELNGDITFKNVSVNFGEKSVLRDISFHIGGGSKTAVIGPTAAGKTQLLYLLTNLSHPTTGSIEFDGQPLDDYKKDDFHRQVGFVFQDSILFNMSIRENIAFSDSVTDESLAKAIATAELKDFIDALPEGLNTVVSERGTTLSGGQKQRIMLARALAIEPRVLLLDDFTARVDTQTEKKILANVRANYPGITLLSVTQKIASIEDYQQIILLMEGEMIAAGTHSHLMETCPEYVQIYQSQRSTSHYEQPELQS
jgi:ATP-binding cassette subfamily B protein